MSIDQITLHPSTGEGTALSAEEVTFLRQKLQQSCIQTLEDLPGCCGIMIIGSMAALVEGTDHTAHKGSDLDVIPITNGPEFDATTRSQIASYLKDKLSANLKSNGVYIKVEAFYPMVYAYPDETPSQIAAIAQSILQQLGTNSHAIILRA